MFQQLRLPSDTIIDTEIVPTHSTPNRELETAIMAVAGWVERLNSGMTSRLGVISHALVASGIVMRVLSRECRYELAAGQ